MVSNMVRINDIPAEVRWEIAARAANSQSVVFDMLVRQIIGDKIDEIWRYTKRMCTGDHHCEYVIEQKK
jgi:hypothetical protein